MSTWASVPRPGARAAFLALPLALLLIVCLSVPAFAASTLVVDNSAGANCNDDGSTGKYCHIQKAIDAAVAGDTIKVYPGNYDETAAGKTLYDNTGPYKFGLFIPQNNLTIQGVDATGNPITNYANVKAFITTNSDANFGPDGIWVQGDGVTISGVDVGVNNGGQNKTIEVIGDNFTLKYSHISDPGGSVYINDWRYDKNANISHIQNYRIEGNLFDPDVTLDINNGAGYSGPVSGRVITGNKFVHAPISPWAVISFSGSDTGVPWFVYGVGGAVITGNQFTGGQQYIRARGTYDNSQFDWKSYWNNNKYEHAAVALANPVTFDVRTYSYVSGSYTFQNVRRIGALIQPELDSAQAGDSVLVKAGTYDEHLTINKFVKLVGAGSDSDPAANTIIHPTTSTSPVMAVSGVGVSNANPLLLQNLRVEPSGFYGIDLGNAQFVRMDNVKVVGSSALSPENEVCLKVSEAANVSGLDVVNSAFTNCDHGWYFAKAKTDVGGPNVSNVHVANTTFANNGYKGIYVEKLSDATFENVAIINNGSGPNWNQDWNAGIDVNLKGQVAYRNLIFKNLTVTGNGLGYKEGAGMMIKARDDATGYNAPNGPATLDYVVIEGGVFFGNERGIRFGEPDKGNNGPTNVQVHHAKIYGNVAHFVGSASPTGSLINQSKADIHAEYNWWGSATGPTASDAVRVNSGGVAGVVPAYLAGQIFTDPYLLTDATLFIPNAPIRLRSNATSFQLSVNLTSLGVGPFSSVAFSVDYDQACLSISSTDANGDGIPDAVSGMPGGFANSVLLNTANTNGELAVAIWYPTAPLASLPAGALVNVKFDILPACQGSEHNTFVKFASTPSVSFADLAGAAAFGTTQDANPLVLDYNQNPTAITLNPNSVLENQPANTGVGTLAATDSDTFNTFTYSLDNTCTGGPFFNDKFTISGDKLLTNAVLDYETKPSYAICVKVDDRWGGSFATPLTINVINVVEPATSISLSPSSVAEGQPVGMRVGEFTASGGDPGATYTYALVGGDGSADNGKFTIAGNELKTAAVFDYSKQSTYYIRVRASNGGADFDKQLVVTVLGHSMLGIGDAFVVRNGQPIAIPVVFTANGNAPTGGSFTLGYNASCLTFTGMTGAMGGPTVAGTVDVLGITGPFVDGQPVVTLNFTASPTCPSGTSILLTIGSPILTGVPGSLPVSTKDGKVLVIANSARGDCNTDGAVNAGDFSAIVLETFDSDGTWWLDAPKSSFYGSPVGCDANASTYIDVADVVCTVLVVFGNNSCTLGAPVAGAAAPAATLTVNPALDGQAVSVPVSLASGGQSIAGAGFTLTYDPAQAAFDTTDANGDGLPDAVTFNVPAELQRSVSVDAAAGQVKIAVYGLKLPLPTIADGPLATIRLQATGDKAVGSVSVTDMALASDSGQNVPVSLSINGQANRSLYLPALSK